jgi:predicted nucleic acid-binding protein
MQTLLDAAFLIDYLRGVPEAVVRFEALFEHGDEPLVNDIVVCEIRAGMRTKDVEVLTALLEPIEFMQPGPDSALLAGQWRDEARSRGHQLSLADALIAAAAESVGAAVLTRNVRDFALTPVRVEAY